MQTSQSKLNAFLGLMMVKAKKHSRTTAVKPRFGASINLHQVSVDESAPSVEESLASRSNTEIKVPNADDTN